MLAVEGLTVRFGAVTAVDRVDLEVRDGEIVCVLGPSGCGKTTLLRAIAGLEPLAAGRVRRDGDDLSGVPPHRRRVGLMFQDHALFPHRTVLGNVAFGLRMQHHGRTDAEARARDALALVDLEGLESRRVQELSGGEQQRVALARALAPAPRLLMLDEPFGSLDRALRERLLVELRALFHRVGVGTLFVTHDQDEAFALADRLVVMADGRVEQTGSPSEVWARPATPFVAGFLGWNVVATPAGQVAVRPSGLRLAADGPIGGRVTSATFRGDHFLVRVATDDGPLDVALAGDPPCEGATLRLAVDPTAAVPLGGAA